jgi:hypothetical protein
LAGAGAWFSAKADRIGQEEFTALGAFALAELFLQLLQPLFRSA